MKGSSPGGFAVVALLATLASPVPAASAPSAGERRVGAWTVGLTKERAGIFAITVNESGGHLGQYCYPEQGACVWVVANDLACEAGETYTVVVNSDLGAAALQIVCLGLEGKAAYAFTDFDVFDAIVHRATRVVLAFPTSNGLFRFSRFSLEGASRAVALMREAAGAMSSKPRGDASGVSF